MTFPPDTPAYDEVSSSPSFPTMQDSHDPRSQALAVRDMTKLFGSHAAVSHLNVDIPKGAIFGIVGPNGAGKTTMLSVATGLMRPTSGRSWVNGYDVWEESVPAKQSMGLLVDGLPTFDRLTGAELLEYVGALRGMDPERIAQRSKSLLEILDLVAARDKQVVDYSAGMTKKILLATALLHNPSLIVLDEPLEAVDPISGRIIQQILRSYAKNGGTVVLSSHVMEIVEGLCDHVAIMKDGKIVVSGHVDAVRGNQSLSDAFVHYIGAPSVDRDSLSWLDGTQSRTDTMEK